MRIIPLQFAAKRPAKTNAPRSWATIIALDEWLTPGRARELTGGRLGVVLPWLEAIAPVESAAASSRGTLCFLPDPGFPPGAA